MLTQNATREEVRLGPASQIPLGEGRTFLVRGDRIAIFRARNGEMFAAEADCPHRAGPLSDGLLGGANLVCPLHGWKFDLRTGQALYGECGLRTWPVRLTEDDEIVLTHTLERE